MNVETFLTDDPYAKALLSELLEPDETPIWSYRPPRWSQIFFPLVDFLMSGTALALFSGGLLYIYLADKALFLFATMLLGIFIALLALSAYSALGKLLNSGRVVYALTNKRLITAFGRWKAQKYQPRFFSDTRRWGNNCGIIWFDNGHMFGDRGYRGALLCVKEAVRVQRLLHKVASLAMQKSTS